ncbi:MAG: hypothetical protein ACI9PP_002050 [Halobacteriales archaeon]|jgi:hypothetical protein
MEDVSNEELIELLYAVEDDLPAAAIVKDDQGPNVIVNTGNPDDTVQAQLEMIAGHMTWLADHTEADLETVAQDALSVAQDMRDAPGFFAHSEDLPD